jgi:hypothetical protein
MEQITKEYKDLMEVDKLQRELEEFKFSEFQREEARKHWLTEQRHWRAQRWFFIALAVAAIGTFVLEAGIKVGWW